MARINGTPSPEVQGKPAIFSPGSWSWSVIFELIVPLLIMVPLGAFFWAIRGTGGWGGMNGGAFAGVGWACCWLLVSRQGHDGRSSRPYGSGWAVAAITLGVAIGGLHGYGQFISWIQGTFQLDDSMSIQVDPTYGWLALLQCGVAWGMVPGVMLAWSNQDKPSKMKVWLTRAAWACVGIGVALVLFFAFPRLTMPFFGMDVQVGNEIIKVDYLAEIASGNAHLARTYETALSSSIQFGAAAGLFCEVFTRKQWRNVGVITTLSLGFGLAFVFTAVWQFRPTFPPSEFFWNMVSVTGWKSWEMGIGLYGGASFAVAHFLFNKRGVKPLERRPSRSEVLVGENFFLGIGIILALYNLFFGEENGLGLKWFPLDQTTSEETAAFYKTMHGTFIAVFVILVACILASVVFSMARFRESRVSRWADPFLKFTVIMQGLLLIGICGSIDLKFGEFRLYPVVVEDGTSLRGLIEAFLVVTYIIDGLVAFNAAHLLYRSWAVVHRDAWYSVQRMAGGAERSIWQFEAASARKLVVRIASIAVMVVAGLMFTLAATELVGPALQVDRVLSMAFNTYVVLALVLTFVDVLLLDLAFFKNMRQTSPSVRIIRERSI